MEDVFALINRTTWRELSGVGQKKRLQTIPQEPQDDVTELFNLFDAHFLGWKGI
jgi:hypothetical protein